MIASVSLAYLFPFSSAWYFWFGLVGVFWFGLILQPRGSNPGRIVLGKSFTTFPTCRSAALNLWFAQQLYPSPATLS